MQKIITVATIAGIAAVAAAWSMSTLPRPSVASKAEIELVPTMTPFEFMVRHGKNLRAESWDAF